MLSVSLGPIALSLNQVLIGIAFSLALAVGALLGRRERIPVAGRLLDILIVATLAARIGFVILYLPEYRDRPLGIIDIRDGGFDPFSGALGAVAFTAWLQWRAPESRRVLGMALLAGLLGWAGMTGIFRVMEESSRPVPDLVLKDLEGNTVRLPELEAGRPRVVNLWASWCPPCVREMPVLEQARDRYPHIGFIYVNQGEQTETIRTFLDEQSLNLSNVLRDSGQEMGRQLGSRALPTTLFYDAGGRLVDSHLGGLSRATLARALERFETDR